MTSDVLWPAVLACLLLALLLWRWEARARGGLGLDGVALLASDDSGVPVPTLRCEPLGLVGRPDHLARAGKTYVPVEVKPSATRLWDSHVLQLAAQCLLVQSEYGRRPPYGLAILADGRSEIVPFTQELEHRVLDTLSEMRLTLLAGVPPKDTASPARCSACAYRRTCPASRARRRTED